MISYICVGVDDMTAAERFYSALLLPLGYSLEFYKGELSYAIPDQPQQPEFYVKYPFNGAPASAGNGSMVAFAAKDQEQVRKLYDDALAAGGSDEGAPGFREDYGPNFYVCYLRDPQKNKIALYSNKSDDS